MRGRAVGQPRRRSPRAALWAAGLAGLAWLGGAEAAAQEASQLRVSGMTFVGSREDGGELVVRARQAVFVPDTNVAHLDEVRASVQDPSAGQSFDLSCDKAALDLDTNSLRAEGNVRGVTSAGESYSAPWVRYDPEADALITDAPVIVENPTGTFRGDGFRYLVAERRLKLTGNVSVVQNP